jgi:Rrf2 family transcriptional regulator, nitric oxide-sensitive transcriptional repressor
VRLTQHTDYAYRMLIHVALRAPALTTVGDVASAFRLSAAHLNKVAQTLAAHNYLETVRGRSGGLRLLRKPESIRLGQVAKVTEPDFQIAPCMASDGDCPIYQPCVLRAALSQAADAFLAELDKWSLADLIKRQSPLLTAIAVARLSNAAR